MKKKLTFDDFIKKAEKNIAALNRLVNDCKQCGPLEKRYILAGLKQAGIPTNVNFWNIFVKAPFIKHIGKNAYIFVNAQPIHKSELARIYRDYRDINKRYSEACRKKETVERVDEVSEQIQQAITLLKNTGEYIILKKSVTYQEI